MKIWPIAAAIANPEATNAQPSFSLRREPLGEDHGDHPEDLGRLGHRAAADHDQRPDHPGEVDDDRDQPEGTTPRRGHDRGSRPVVRSARNVAPWSRHSTSRVTPVISP